MAVLSWFPRDFGRWFLPRNLLKAIGRLFPTDLHFKPRIDMTLLQSLEQFFWSGVDVLKAIFLVLEPHLDLYVGLVLWIVFCTGALNWVRLRKIILSGRVDWNSLDRVCGDSGVGQHRTA